MKPRTLDELPERKIRFNYLSTIFLGVIALFTIVILFLTFYPVEVIKPNVQPYKVLTKTVVRGNPVTYIVDACKGIDAVSTVYRQFVLKGGSVLMVPPITNNVPKGCNQTTVSVDVPKDALPGTYYMTLDITYKINVFQDRTYHFRTEDFTVTREIGPTQ